MVKNILLLFLLLSLFFRTQAQTEIKSFFYFDSLSYRYFIQKNLDSLLHITDEAQLNGYESYYFRIRRGLLLFSYQRYAESIKEFEKALTFYKHDPLTLEYLYLAYVSNQEYRKAYWITKFMPPTLLKKYKIRKFHAIEVSLNASGGQNNFLTSVTSSNQVPPDIFVPILFLSNGGRIQINTQLSSIIMQFDYNTFTGCQYIRQTSTKSDTLFSEGKMSTMYVSYTSFWQNKSFSLAGFFNYQNYSSVDTTISQNTMVFSNVQSQLLNFGYGGQYSIYHKNNTAHLIGAFIQINNTSSLIFEILPTIGLTRNNNVSFSLSLTGSVTLSRPFQRLLSIEPQLSLKPFSQVSITGYSRFGSIQNLATDFLYVLYPYPYTVDRYYGLATHIRLTCHWSIQVNYTHMFNALKIQQNGYHKMGVNFQENILKIQSIWEF